MKAVQMDITVIVCTFNRCESLRVLLESVERSKVPNGTEWEVLVVDNNSTDHTRQVVEEFCSHEGGQFRYLFEARQGKSFALNSGIQEARGEILVFTDDDVTVEQDWLQNLTANLHSEEWAGAAGRVLRTWNCPQPNWLSLEPRYEKMAWALVSFDLDQESGELPRNCPPVGANMAFHREVFLEVGGFRTDLGPKGNETGDSSVRKAGPLGNVEQKAPRRYDDTEFGRRLVQSGHRMRYEPLAVVYHPVQEERLTKKFFLYWWFGRGRDTNLILQDKGPIWGIPRSYFQLAKMFCLLVGNSFAWLTAFGLQRRFYYKLMTWESAGSVMGAIIARRSPFSEDHAVES
jgi:glucosyl-dolichyl phosphate glucuronosyltransferase